jgi:hypothetical protein
MSPLINVKVDSPALRNSLKQYQVGDRVHLTVSYVKAQDTSGTAPNPDPTAAAKQAKAAGSTGGNAPTASTPSGPAKPSKVAGSAGGKASTPTPAQQNAISPAPAPQANAAINDTNKAAVLTDLLGAYSRPLSVQMRFLVLLFSTFGLFGIAALVTGGRPLAFVIGMDNRYSNSKVQVACWFWIVISTYISAWLFRVWSAGWDYAGMITIPQNLLVLSGLSVITYGGAKAITTAKADAAPGAKTAATDAERRFVPNLVQNDAGGFDFGDFQMLVVTMLAVATYLMVFFHFFDAVPFTKAITLPDVDTTILSIFGLGQGAYLAKKAGGDPGTS